MVKSKGKGGRRRYSEKGKKNSIAVRNKGTSVGIEKRIKARSSRI